MGVLDERVFAGDKLRRSGEDSRYAFAFIRNAERQAGLAFERLSGALDFLPLQAPDEIPWRTDATLGRAPGVPLFNESILSPLQRPAHVGAAPG